uniref:Uncharacterized protein n=1 Tax=Macrostomum lignano TaxID=282301 RepID=A0A1I8JRR9_9PLAT
MGKLMEQRAVAVAPAGSGAPADLGRPPIQRGRGATREMHRQSAAATIRNSLIGPGEMNRRRTLSTHGMDLSTYAASPSICVQPTEVFVLDSKNFEAAGPEQGEPGGRRWRFWLAKPRRNS